MHKVPVNLPQNLDSNRYLKLFVMAGLTKFVFRNFAVRRIASNQNFTRAVYDSHAFNQEAHLL